MSRASGWPWLPIRLASMVDLGDATTMRLRRSPHVSFFARRGQVFAWQGLRGEVIGLSDDLRRLVLAFGAGGEDDAIVSAAHGDVAASYVPALLRLGLLERCDLPTSRDFSRGFPVRARWACWREAGEVVAAVQGRTLHDQPVTVRLNIWESQLFRAMDGCLTLYEIAASLDGRPAGAAPKPSTLARAEAAALRWLMPDRQWIRMLPASAAEGAPRWADSTMPYPALGDDATPEDLCLSADGAIDNRRWHIDEITSADAQFEDHETTLAHLFRHPHAALGGRTFGAAWVAAMAERGALPQPGAAVVEVGAGTGKLTAAVLEALAAKGLAPRSWRIIEVSPVLAAAQASALREFGTVVTIDPAAVEDAEWAPESVDLVFCNEMIGDLRHDPLVDGVATTAEGRRWAQRLAIAAAEAPSQSWLNTGALALLARAATALRPGGLMWMSEFGSLTAWPVESTHLDHAEVSIHFGHLRQLAASLGLTATVEPVPSVIGLDPQPLALQSTATWFRNLRHLLAEAGVTVDKRAWTRDALLTALGDRVALTSLGNIAFAPLGERVMGLRPSEFLALIARRPGDRAGAEAA